MPDASKPIQKGAVPSHLVALPSLSNSLSSLPQAKSLAHVAVYTSSMSGQHAADSEAKLKKALSNNVGSAQTLAYATSVSRRSRRPSDCGRAYRTETCMQPSAPSHNQATQPLMMKRPARTKIPA